MRESDIQTLFSRQNKIDTIYEIKLVKYPKKTLPYSRVEPHQITALMNANSDKGLSFKISDMSMEKKPCDGFRISNHPAHIVVLYYIPRKPKVIYYIPIKSFVATVGPGQGLSEDKAKELAEYTITI